MVPYHLLQGGTLINGTQQCNSSVALPARPKVGMLLRWRQRAPGSLCVFVLTVSLATPIGEINVQILIPPPTAKGKPGKWRPVPPW